MATNENLLSIRDFGLTSTEERYGHLQSIANEKQQKIASKAADIQRLRKSDFVVNAAVGSQNNNQISQDPLVQDLNNLSPAAFEAKYGAEAAALAQGYSQTYRGLQNLKDQTRTDGQVAGDAALDTANMLGQTVLGAGQLAALPYDYVTGLHSGKYLAQASQGLNKISQDLGSDLRATRTQIQQMEGALNQADNIAQRDNEVDSGNLKLWADAKMMGRGFVDTIQNYSDDPIMLGSLVPELVGTMVPTAIAIKAAGKAGALKHIQKTMDMTRTQANAFLKTKAGQAILSDFTKKKVPLMIGLTEAGTTINEAQSEILAMSEEELMQSPQYRQYIETGMTPDDARRKIILNASSVAGATAFAVGIATGRIGRKFEYAPFSAGSGASFGLTTPAVRLGVSAAKEGIEETLQEGAGAAFGTNLGQAAVGLNDDVFAGVGEAGGEGALGGAFTTAALGAPSAIGETAANVVISGGVGTIAALASTGKTILDGIDRATDIKTNAADAQSQTGISATQSAINIIIESVDTIAQSDVSDTAKQEIVQEITEAITINDGEASIADWITSLDDAKITDVTPGQATQVISALAAVQNIASDTLKEKVNALDEADPVRQVYNTAVEQMNTVESSTILEKSKEVISKLSADEIKQLVPLDQLSDENTSQEQKKAITQTAAVVSRINPQAFTAEEYDIVLNQMSPEDAGKISQNDRTSIKTARANAQISAQTDTQKESNKERFKKVIRNLAPAQAAKLEQERRDNKKKTVAEVTIDIRERGNTSSKDNKASLAQYVANVNQLMAEGKINAAQDLLTNLGNFAQSQINKIGSINKASQDGATGKAYTFKTWIGSYFKESKLKVFVNKNSPASLLFALDAYADTQEVINTYEALRNAYPELGSLEQKTAPALDLKIDELLDNFPTQRDQRIEETTSAPAEQAVTQETTEETSDDYENAISEDLAEYDESQKPVKKERRLRKDAVLKKKESLIDYDDDTVEESQAVDTSPQEAPETEPSETVTESPAPAKEIKRTPLKDALTNLFGGAANKIASVFKRKEEGSDLLDMENIAEELVRRFKENNKSEEAITAYNTLLGKLASLEKYIEEYINIDEKRAASFLKNLNLKDKPNLRILELFDQDTLKLNEKVSIAVAMAAAEWITELRYDAYKTDRRKLNSLFAGRKPYDPITEVVERAGDFGGITQQAALQSLSKKIQNILGVQENKAADPEDAQGIFGSLATTVFAALQEKSLIETATFRTEEVGKPNKNGNRRHAQIRFAVRPNIKNADTKAIRQNVSELNMPFSKALNIESDSFYIGAPKVFVKNQTRWNKFSFLTKLMEKALSANQNIAHKLNTPLITVLDVLNTDTLASLLGQVAIDETKMHPDDVRSQRGKNQTIVTSLESLATWRKLIERYAAENDMNIKDVPVHFEAAVGSNGRINQVAPSNVPQSDKLLRELLVPSQTVVDMSDETTMTSYWAGISQALGGKIEKSPSFDDVKADAQERLSERQEAISYLKKILLDSALSEADSKKFKAQLRKFDFDMKILHALLAEAARQNAVDQNAKEFTTHLTIEADGVTDGPINSVINLLTPSQITPQLLEIMASGGLIFGNDPATLDDYYNRGSVDLYAMIAEKLGERLNNSFKDNPRLAALMNIADGFLDGLDREKGSLIIDRELVKNPITVFLYNSSPSGIADKITELTVKNFAALMTKVAQKKGELTDSDVYKENETALKAFMVSSDPKYANKRITDKQVNDFYKNPLTRQINKEKLKKDYLDIFVEPLLEAINDTLPGLKENMTFLNDIAKTQTELFQIVFKENADALQQKLGRSLSQDDLEIVLKQSLKVAPIFYTTTMGLEVSELRPATTKKSIAQDFREKFQFFETTKEPADAKFKMVPNFVQSTGDGGMIANAYANDKNNLMDKSIQVFDGIEMSIDTFSDGSEHINQQVFNNWLSTKIYEEVQRSIDQVVSIKDLPAGAQELQTKLKEFMPQLVVNIDRSKKLKKIVQDFPSSTDHMAGAKRAYVNEGKESLAGIGAFDFEAMARELDKQFQKSLPAKPIDGVAKPSKAFMDAVKKIGSVVKGHDKVVQISGAALTSLLKSKNFTDDQKLVFAEVIENDTAFEKHIFYFGDPKDLEALRDDMHPNLPKYPISLGQTFTKEPVAFIGNMSPETLLHEMLHASLVTRILKIKETPKEFTPEIQKALANLEGLKTAFLNMDVTTIPDLVQDEREALTAMQDQIKNLNDGTEALSEFLSWSMSNKALIDKAKRTKVHKPLVEMVLKTLRAIKNFLGIKNPGVDMFSNIVFNTAVITRSFTPYRVTANKVFEQRYGANTHIEQVESIFLERVRHFIDGAVDELEPAVIAMEKLYREAKADNLYFDAARAIEKLNNNFFRLDQRQSNTFSAIYASLRTGFKIDSSAMQEATQLYNQVVDKLTAKDFVTDWARSSQAEKDQAQAKLDALIEESPITMIALAQVDESFSNALSKFTSDPDTPLDEGSQVDRAIRNVATGVASTLSRLLTTTRDNSKPVNQQLAALTVAMAEIQKERRFVAESFVMNAQMKANTWAADKIYEATGAATTKLEKIAKQYNEQSKTISVLMRGASFVTGMANRERSKQMLDELQSELNKARKFDWIQALVADLRSDRPDMIRLGKALNKIRAEADRVRQFQKDLRIKYMIAAFEQKLTEQDNKDLFMGLGRTDISTIGRENVLALLKSPETITQRINDTKKELRQLAPQQYNAYLGKIKSLANYMMTWEVDTPNLLRNAHAIGNLFNENNRPDGPVDQRVLVLISQLTSLEAFNSLSSDNKASLKRLIQTETNGIEIVVGNLAEVHSNEFGRRVEGREGEISLNNGWKGYLPMNFAQGQEVIIADDRDQAKLEQEGWVRLRGYFGDPRETNPTSRGLYQTTVGGKGQFRQGILQTVHKQWHGVDPRNGVTNSSQATSGFLTGAAATRVSQSNAQARTGQDVDYMLPVFDNAGVVMGYEYSIPMRDLEGSAPEMNLIESLGSWFGRIEEEEVSGQLNKAAVLQQKAIYDKEYNESNANEWINIADPDIADAVYKDAWSVLGYETKSSAVEAFGAPNFFPVKRAEIDSTIGYRLANPKDLWTGVSRIDDNTRKIMRDVISLPFGKNTYQYMNKGYGVVSSAVSWGKVNIVIRSGIVPIGNFISNMMHLATWGVGFGSQLANMPTKLKEISRVTRIQEEIGKLSTELPSIINNQGKVKRIEAKIKALEAEQEAMSIWPVLQANEFSTISESLTRADVALRQGSIFDWLEKQADKLPPLAGDLTKTAILAKDTELFKMMHHFMQYGDFIAKSMLYDHLLETQQKTPEDALDIISVEYVNYNRPAGRWRDALETSGLLWFSNYALRIMPIMLNLIRDRPVSALFYGGAVAPAMDIDTVISGSAPGKAWRDALGYSFGPGMGFRSIQLNPIINSVF